MEELGYQHKVKKNRHELLFYNAFGNILVTRSTSQPDTLISSALDSGDLSGMSQKGNDE